MVDYVIHHVRLNALALRTNHVEIVNSLTHGAGLVLATSGALLLTAKASTVGDAWRLAGCLIFATALVAVYAASTLSHLAQRRPWRDRFRTWDQALIYLLISGTNTPFALAYLRDGGWWLLTGGMWVIAFTGFWMKVGLRHRIYGISLWLYLMLGWLPIIGLPGYLDLIPSACLWWVLAGGVCYTIGAAFLMLDHYWRYLHAVWHLLVIAGSACHYFGVWEYVATA
jgi:hemolysin III